MISRDPDLTRKGKPTREVRKNRDRLRSVSLVLIEQSARFPSYNGSVCPYYSALLPHILVDWACNKVIKDTSEHEHDGPIGRPSMGIIIAPNFIKHTHLSWISSPSVFHARRRIMTPSSSVAPQKHRLPAEGKSVELDVCICGQLTFATDAVDLYLIFYTIVSFRQLHIYIYIYI